ncbi:MAG: universal stress protein [Planctomycetota bacterium]|jgi:nucleotide-binding universal stress UspA family protein
MSISPPKNLLVPVDFSDASRIGLRGAAEAAGRFGASITVLHVEVATAAFTEAMAGTGLLKEAEEAGRRHRDELRVKTERFASESLGETPAAVVVADAIFVPDAVVELAAEQEVGWICMGATGQRLLERIVLGSTAAEVVRASPVPVLIVRPRTGADESASLLGEGKSVLVAVDLGEGSRRLVEAAAELARPTGKLTVLHVVESPMERGMYGTPLAVPAEDMKAAIEWCQVALGKLSAEIEDTLLQPPEVRVGRPGAQTLQAIEELAPDLTVVGTHGRHGLDRLALGSVAERVARRAAGPVLVVPTHEDHMEGGP